MYVCLSFIKLSIYYGSGNLFAFRVPGYFCYSFPLSENTAAAGQWCGVRTGFVVTSQKCGSGPSEGSGVLVEWSGLKTDTGRGRGRGGGSAMQKYGSRGVRTSQASQTREGDNR